MNWCLNAHIISSPDRVCVRAHTCVCARACSASSLFVGTDLESQSEDVFAKWKLSSSRDGLRARARFCVHDSINVLCKCKDRAGRAPAFFQK